MRKITVLVESTQSKVVMESNANTLGELKNELRERQVSFNDDDVFKESRTKSILASDESPLPVNVPWKGSTTNDLVFMISAPQKKIKSGTMSRKEAYDKVRELNLMDTIQKKEGRNFTQVSTAILVCYIEKAEKKSVKEKSSKKEATPVISAPVAKEKASAKKADSESSIEAAKELIAEMVEKNAISEENATNLLMVLDGKDAAPVVEEKTYDELAKDFNF